MAWARLDAEEAEEDGPLSGEVEVALRRRRSPVPEPMPPAEMSAAWRMLLYGDGSPTRLLQLITGSATSVRVLSQTSIAGGDDGAPEAIAMIRAPRLRREVELCNERGEHLGYAVSWWNEEDYHAYLPDPSRPIGGSLAARRVEVFRDILAVYRGTSRRLRAQFDEAPIMVSCAVSELPRLAATPLPPALPDASKPTPITSESEGHRGCSSSSSSSSSSSGDVDGGESVDLRMWGRHYMFWRDGRPLALIMEVFSPHLSVVMGPSG